MAVYLVRDDRLVLETHAGHSTPPPPTLSWPADADDIAADGSIRLPLTIGQERIGVLMAADDVGRAWIRSRRRFLSAAAATAGVALRHARTIARARRELTRARAPWPASPES